MLLGTSYNSKEVFDGSHRGMLLCRHILVRKALNLNVLSRERERERERERLHSENRMNRQATPRGINGFPISNRI
jgi:hypothetical protein